MSAEVISMEEFQKDAKCDGCGAPLNEEAFMDEKWKWAQEKSLECILEGEGTHPIIMLIANLVDDTLDAAKEIMGVDFPEEAFHEAVRSGIAMYKDRWKE
jgi:hypothetical protein